MTPINTNHEEVFYITESCYVIPQRYVLVNHDKQSERLADLPWKLLDCLMRHQDTKVKYDRIYVEVWGDPYHDSGDVATIMHRLKKYFRDIGVDDDELKEVFQTFRGDGLLFTPHKPLRPPIDELEEKLRSIGVSKSDFFEIVDCMLYRGISGRMGRERIIALAKKGNRLAAAELGELYYHYIARNHKPDYKKACEYYRLAGDRNPLSLWTLGYCIMNNYYPVVEPDKIDYLAAKNYFVRAIQIKTEEGISAAAYTSLGQLWEEGHYPADSFATTHECLPADIDQAVKYYEIADEAGYHYATNRLGRHYERISAGIEGGSPLKKKAFSYFSRSVDLIADGYALNKLGQYYETGFGCEVNPDKACECYMRGVDEVLEDDITGWNFFNAGRVCANRIKNQPLWYCNLPRAFDLFNDALHKLPTREHGKVIIEMMEILSFDDVSALDTAVVKRKKYEMQYRVNLYLDEVEKADAKPNEEIVAKVKLLAENL